MEILFESGDYVAVNKREHIASISESVKNGLPELLKEKYPEKLFPVHRLDKEASGVVIFARNGDAHRHLNCEFDRRAVAKSYLLLVHGNIPQTRGTIDKPIREFGSGRMGVDPACGKQSLTEFEVKERIGDFNLIEAHPLTGRRHQLRVHFYSIGHPVVGDLRYGDRLLQETFPRLMLHALMISFSLASGEVLTIEAPIPPSFNGFLQSLRNAQ